MRSALADDDLACADNLTAETLDAQTLRVAVASVSGAGCTLLVCHGSCPLVARNYLAVLMSVTLTAVNSERWP